MRNIRLIFLSIILPLLYGCAQMRASKGWSLLDKGRTDEAIKAFELSRQKKELPGYYLGMYYSYVEKQDKNKAEEYITLGVEKFPNDYHLNYAMGYFLLKAKGDKQSAVNYFEKCKNLDVRNQFVNELDLLIAEARN